MIDVLIIGGGPAGLSSAIYAKRAGLTVQILDKGAADCQLAKAADVENYLGFTCINGIDLHNQFLDHAKKMEIPILRKGVVSVEKLDDCFKVYTKKDEFYSKNLVLAMGRSHKMLGVNGEEKFQGAGVSYCATCDGFFFRDKTVCVVGGGDSALSQAIYLSAICKKVILIHRRNTFRAANYLVAKAEGISNIEFILDAKVQEILGQNYVTGVSINLPDKLITVECDGIFGAIGEKPNLTFEIDGLETTSNGQIITDNYCRTSISHLYAVGDIREREVYQVVTAVADGALVIEGILKDN